MCCNSIDITAKSGSGSAIIRLRQKELISNLRVLVAVRFEQAIDMTLLVFGGQMLRDEGTIDGHGIVSGVTVHVVFRPLSKEPPAVDACSNSSLSGSSAPSNARTWLLKSGDIFKPLLEDLGSLRVMLQSDSRIKTMLDENASFRHFLSSDRNLRELLSTVFNPAKVQELGRKRDLYIKRMEWMPGGYQVLSNFNCFMRQAHEDNVAMNYKETLTCQCNQSADNPQRGRENNMPLPNPWRKPMLERMVANLTVKCNQMMQSLQLGDSNKTLEHARQLNELTDNVHRQLDIRARKLQLPPEQSALKAVTLTAAVPPAMPSLNLCDFMSSNDSLWEQRFRSQLIQLTTLGHTDRQRNICALLMSAGDIQTAVKLLKQWNR